MARPLYEIASDIEANWPDPYIGAVHYIVIMGWLDSIDDDIYGIIDAYTIVLFFLEKASTWHGEDADRIKAELSEMIGT